MTKNQRTGTKKTVKLRTPAKKKQPITAGSLRKMPNSMRIPRRKMSRKAGSRARKKKLSRMTIPWKPAKPVKMKMKPTHKTVSNSPQETAGCFHIYIFQLIQQKGAMSIDCMLAFHKA